MVFDSFFQNYFSIFYFQIQNNNKKRKEKNNCLFFFIFNVFFVNISSIKQIRKVERKVKYTHRKVVLG